MTTKSPHRLMLELHQLREARGLSLGAVENRHPTVTAVRLGSYERGDRKPSVEGFDELLREVYGKRLAIVPDDIDFDEMLAELYDLRRFRQQILGALDNNPVVRAEYQRIAAAEYQRMQAAMA